MNESIHLGKFHESSQYPLPQVADFRDSYRVVTANDAAPVYPAENMPLNLTYSRLGVGNKVVVLVDGSAAGVTVALYARYGDKDFLVASQTTTAAQQVLVFTEIPAFVLGTKVTGLAVQGTATLSAGTTR